ncbi:MAG: hypothetical protein ACREEM_26230 [Blastocatellia bacterium]
MSILSATQDHVAQTTAKILGFGELPVGWHYGGGVPPAEPTIAAALRLNREAEELGFEKTNAFPGIEGEIQVTAYLGSLCLEFTVERDGGITFVKEQDDQEIAYESALTLDEAIGRLHAVDEANGFHPNYPSEALRP